MKWLTRLLPDVTQKLRGIIRREIQRDVQQNLVTHAAARQSFDLYEMRLETLDTRIAKRMIALEKRIAALEDAQTVVGQGATSQPVRSVPMREAG